MPLWQKSQWERLDDIGGQGSLLPLLIALSSLNTSWTYIKIAGVCLFLHLFLSDRAAENIFINMCLYHLLQITLLFKSRFPKIPKTLFRIRFILANVCNVQWRWLRRTAVLITDQILITIQNKTMALWVHSNCDKIKDEKM